MPNVELRSIKAKSTSDLIVDTVKSLRLGNTERSKELLKEMGFSGGVNDFVKITILEFLRQIDKSAVAGYRVLLFNLLTLYPDAILHDDLIENATITLKADISDNLLAKMRNTRIQFKETVSSDSIQDLPV